MNTLDTISTIPTEKVFPFSFYLPICKAYDGQDGETWVIEGPLSDPGADLQGDEMDMSGLQKGMELFFRLGGHVDWDHLWERTRDPDYLIGRGVEMYLAKHPTTGIDVPWLRVSLFRNKEMAAKAVRHLKAGGSLGFSVAGAVKMRDPINKSKILEPLITSVAVTPVPVVSANAGCIQFVKSLLAAMAQAENVNNLHFPVVPELKDRVEVVFQKLSKSDGLGGNPQMTAEPVDSAAPLRTSNLQATGGTKRRTDDEKLASAEQSSGKRSRKKLTRKAIYRSLADLLEELVQKGYLR